MTAVHHGMIPSSLLSVEFIQSVFKAAMYDTTVDDDGDVVVDCAGDMRVFLSISGNKKGLGFSANFSVDEQAGRPELLEAANDFNMHYTLTRAYIVTNRQGEHLARFDSFCVCPGGLSPVNLIFRFRDFEYTLMQEHPLHRFLG